MYLSQINFAFDLIKSPIENFFAPDIFFPSYRSLGTSLSLRLWTSMGWRKTLGSGTRWTWLSAIWRHRTVKMRKTLDLNLSLIPQRSLWISPSHFQMTYGAEQPCAQQSRMPHLPVFIRCTDCIMLNSTNNPNIITNHLHPKSSRHFWRGWAWIPPSPRLNLYLISSETCWRENTSFYRIQPRDQRAKVG